MRWAFIVITLASATVCAQESLPLETLAKVKQATCYISAEDESNENRTRVFGSGFVIKVEGTTAFIVTNAHVVAHRGQRGGYSGPRTAKVYLRSGTKAETESVAELVAVDAGRDLALLSVKNVANLPAPVELGSNSEPFETMPVYIFGFPFGEGLALGKANPPVNVGRGQVSSLRRDDDDRLTSVLLDGALNPGNSGGPVVDAKGRLVGISRATIRGANIGFAIAVPELLAMLDGTAEPPIINLTPAAADAGVRLSVEVPLLDPLGRLKSAQLLYARGTAKFSRKKRPDPSKSQPAPGDDDDAAAGDSSEAEPAFVFGPMEGAESKLLAIDHARATATLEIPPGRDEALWGQVAYVNGSGKTIHSRPSRYLLGAVQSTDAERKGGETTLFGEVIDPDGDCEISFKESAILCEVPGTLHDLNIDIAATNAPRIVRPIDGDFTAKVHVTGSFKPGGTRTGPKSVPYNGGGLLAWLDRGNYVRLERGAMYRNGRVLGLLIFESREHGARATVHNKGKLDPAQDLWLRLERRGRSFAAFYSSDGKAWDELEPIEVDWPTRVSVGVDAINSCGDPMSVRFGSYSLHPRSGVPR
jgi:regulation of enolase protein 1 (concanavalin A-like superfamily)